MDDQIFIPGMEPSEATEQTFLASITPQMEAAVEAGGGDRSLLTVKTTMAYSVVTLGTLTVFRLRFRKKRHSISVPTSFEDLIPMEWTPTISKSEQKFLRLDIGDRPLEGYADFLCALAGAAVDRYPKDWDCCSRYMECSDARKCVHPDSRTALSCGYRRVLNSGRVFYGKNRNV